MQRLKNIIRICFSLLTLLVNKSTSFSDNVTHTVAEMGYVLSPVQRIHLFNGANIELGVTRISWLGSESFLSTSLWFQFAKPRSHALPASPSPTERITCTENGGRGSHKGENKFFLPKESNEYKTSKNRGSPLKIPFILNC